MSYEEILQETTERIIDHNKDLENNTEINEIFIKSKSEKYEKKDSNDKMNNNQYKRNSSFQKNSNFRM